ncbi:MAG: translocation/assembly module TamB domain-containing protein, partial [Pseudomonadota bacterium]
EIVFSRGQLRLSSDGIAIKPIAGALGDATVRVWGDPDRCDVDGFCAAVQLSASWRPSDVYLGMTIGGLSHRIPRVLELELNTDLVLTGDSEQLRLEGLVDIVHGRYVEPLLRSGDMFVRNRTSERSTPFWQGLPLLENLDLELLIRTTGVFLVKNNLADLTLTGEIALAGTPARPMFDRQISTQEGGTIKMTGLRPVFTVQSGELTFSRLDSFPDKTPSILVRGQADFADSEGRSHLISLRFEGTLEKFQMILETNTGLNTAQTLALITTKRVDANELLRGSSVQNTSPDRVPTSEMAASLGGTINSVIQDLSGEAIASLIEDPLKGYLRLDCFRFEAGTESFRLAGCKNLSRRVRLDGDGEFGLAGGRQLSAGLKYEIHDNMGLEMLWNQDTPKDESKGSEDRYRAQFKYRLIIP